LIADQAALGNGQQQGKQGLRFEQCNDYAHVFSIALLVPVSSRYRA
jgi:hypothetical protein